MTGSCQITGTERYYANMMVVGKVFKGGLNMVVICADHAGTVAIYTVQVKDGDLGVRLFLHPSTALRQAQDDASG